jgi:hypothetical protein
VASNDHETTPRTRREGDEKGKEKMHGSVKAPARSRSRHEGPIGGRRQRKRDMITRDMRLEGRTWVGARKRKKCVLQSFVQNIEHVEGMSKMKLQPGNYGC